ncbi:E3 ubiquitin-protein ligase MGRN1 isoform X3 [Bradysia coprophila]|uniref:E3 ubiquitin-protein ligase MGRN1 isoform X3 n=1 Tax=Bradysia coprophila TaxID=38358 RepID=UPI00187D7184|nr:E3 ubiquitin-protein ligase MGRN1 isoform X3 [Bradysia coprophila]
MGSIASRQNADVEEAEIGSNQIPYKYKYPPKSGNYFGSHFIMGGERFDTPQPEAYLFGENADLNFLGSRPTAVKFPYPPPQANEPTKTLKSLVNIRKESVRFAKAPDCATKIHGDGSTNKGNSFNIEFIYEADAKCAVTIYYFCTEDITSNGVNYIVKDPSLTSETFHCSRGVNQLFSQNSHIFNPSLYSDEELCYNPERDVYPIVIHCVVEEGVEAETKQSHTTICVVDHHSDGTYVLRALKQKIYVDGLCYLLQEIYGIENKNINKVSIDDETDDNGSECVICMSDTRDTLILPCRHLCLCNSCADSLRYQANNCPICRAPFRALLQIRAVQKSVASALNITPQQDGDNIPPGYSPVSLIEALNGPPQVTVRNQTTTDVSDGADTDATNAAEILNRSSDSGQKDSARLSKTKNPPEIRMSVLMAKDDPNSGKHSATTNIREKSPRLKNNTKVQSGRDSVKIVNEKNAANLQPVDVDEDSDAEKLSPLLDPKVNEVFNNNKIPNSALHIEGVDESIDDTDTEVDDHDEKKTRPILTTDNDASLAGAEDSDYYTPEDPHTTILSPLCPEKVKGSIVTKQ